MKIFSTSQMELQSWNTELTQNRKLFLIRKTLEQRLNFVNTNSSNLLEEYLKTHPHYMDGQMMLYEYSLVLKKTSPNGVSFSDLQTNTVRFLHKLLQHFKVPDTTQALELLQAKLIPVKYQKEHIALPFSTVHFNEAHGDRHLLYTNHDVQSPCIVLVIDIKEENKPVLKRSILKMGKGMISTILDPSPSTAILHLMAPYFLFDSAYPKAYESMMRLLEKQVHGFLCAHTSKSKPMKEFVTFMKEFLE
ncbi:30S ribosomal protein S24e [Frankliniella fusca]|uniref:30S ribosomal protein S24e n=1 Tax=Frankliniella fusca TaxID=407009 RepID=A0AAE1I4D0_9NEOP|nr:30S ribosomal protein S24e [Frankliniella fusca]